MITVSRAVVFCLFVIVAFVVLGLAAFLVWLAVYAVGWVLFGRRDRGRHRGRRRWRTGPRVAAGDPHPDVPEPTAPAWPPAPDGPPPGFVWIAAEHDPHAVTTPIPQVEETAA